MQVPRPLKTISFAPKKNLETAVRSDQVNEIEGLKNSSFEKKRATFYLWLAYEVFRR